MPLPTALTGQINTQIVVRANITDANGLPATSSVVWTTSNAVVAGVQNAIDISGGALITCFNVGTATITATAGSINAVFNLTVVNVTPGAAVGIDIGADFSLQPIKKMQ